MSRTVVCFDIGGVLVRICHTWNDAARAAGVETTLGAEIRKLDDSSYLLAYQEGRMPLDDYLANMAEWLGTDREGVIQVHNRILLQDYPGAFDLVEELKSKGIWTCCFSNTNGLHWIVLTDPDHFPAVAALDKKIASHELKAAKPDVAAYKQVEELMPFKPDRIVFFDDTLRNVVGANEAGWEAFRLDPAADPIQEARAILSRLEVL